MSSLPRAALLVCCLSLFGIAAAPPVPLTPAQHAKLQRAETLYERAWRLARAGKRAGAVAAMQRYADAYQEVLGANHPRSTASLGELASLYHSLGDDARALPLME